MDHRITIRRLTVGGNEFNEPLDTWADVATIYARKQEMTGAESVRSDEVTGTLAARFRIRQSSVAATITASDRVLFEGRDFNIVGIKRIGSRWIDLDVVQRVGINTPQYIVTIQGDRIVTVSGAPLVTAR